MKSHDNYTAENILVSSIIIVKFIALSLSYQHRELLYSLFTVCVLVCAMLSARPSCSKDVFLVGRPHVTSVEYDVIKIISVESQLRPLYDV